MIEARATSLAAASMACTREERFVLRIYLPSGDYKSMFAATFHSVNDLCILCEGLNQLLNVLNKIEKWSILNGIDVTRGYLEEV